MLTPHEFSRNDFSVTCPQGVFALTDSANGPPPRATRCSLGDLVGGATDGPRQPIAGGRFAPVRVSPARPGQTFGADMHDA